MPRLPATGAYLTQVQPEARCSPYCNFGPEAGMSQEAQCVGMESKQTRTRPKLSAQGMESQQTWTRPTLEGQMAASPLVYDCWP